MYNFILQGGDLFDAIAADIKYSEPVARDMVKDLANALQVILFKHVFKTRGLVPVGISCFFSPSNYSKLGKRGGGY